MPQIAQLVETFFSQLFWLIITFGLVYLVIGRGMLPKIQSTVELREKRIADDVEAAKIAHARADEIEEDYRRQQQASRDAAHAITAAAKDQAAKNAERRLKDADAKVAEHIAAAEAEIARQREAALAELEAVASDAAREIVGKLTTVEIADGEARSAVKEALARA